MKIIRHLIISRFMRRKVIGCFVWLMSKLFLARYDVSEQTQWAVSLWSRSTSGLSAARIAPGWRCKSAMRRFVTSELARFNFLLKRLDNSEERRHHKNRQERGEQHAADHRDADRF